MPDCGIEQEFGGIKWVGGYYIKDALLHLGVFPGTETNRPLIAFPCSNKFRDDNYKPGVKACFLAKDCHELGNGLVDSIYTTTLFAHKEVIRATN